MEGILVDFRGQWLGSDFIPHRRCRWHNLAALAFFLSWRLLGRRLFGDEICLTNHLRTRLICLANVACSANRQRSRRERLQTRSRA
jgi:hypothetical protein